MRIEPASLTKLMTIYLAFKRIQSGEMALHDKISISKKAWRMEGSRMFVEVGDSISVIKMLKGIIVQSGNDASVAMAEHIAGTEEAFVSMMNDTALELGMKGTHFENATGLPGPEHYSTSHDIALLSAELIKQFPDYYVWFSLKKFKHNKIEQPNRNRLLYKNIGVDGLKTGHTESAGYCLAASSLRNDLRFIAVVTGTNSDKERAEQAAALLEFGHENYVKSEVVKGNEAITLPVYEGLIDKVKVELSKQLPLIEPKSSKRQYEYRYQLPSSVVAPLAKGQTISIAELVYGEQLVKEIPMIITVDVEKGSFFKRGIDKIKRMIDEF